ncbi:MAG TPA: metallophosphoesterase [Chthonomonadaceae bacterium]|nr:metallophosphoesterase [Chthonomonadaceae bacterium]
MGYRFSLEDANMVAWLLSDTNENVIAPWEAGASHQLSDRLYGHESPLTKSLEGFLERLRFGFRSSARGEFMLARFVDDAIGKLRRGRRVRDALAQVRHFMTQYPWTALIVPSGTNRRIDEEICSDHFLRELIYNWLEGPGLILQLDKPPERVVDLSTPFPAFRTALANIHNWPGLLVWSGSDSFFTSRGDTQEDKVYHLRRAVRLLDELTARHYDWQNPAAADKFFEILKAEFVRKDSLTRSFHVIQLSDIHLGANQANERLGRLRSLVRQLATEYGTDLNVLPVISGDIIDTPTTGNWGLATDFVRDIDTQFTNPSFFVRGNHDCRRSGFASRSVTLGGYIQPSRIRWFDRYRLAVVGFDSCEAGDLGAGGVTPNQLDELGADLDEDQTKRDFRLIGIVHHHPMSVPLPDWLLHRGIWKFRF